MRRLDALEFFQEPGLGPRAKTDHDLVLIGVVDSVRAVTYDTGRHGEHGYMLATLAVDSVLVGKAISAAEGRLTVNVMTCPLRSERTGELGVSGLGPLAWLEPGDEVLARLKRRYDDPQRHPVESRRFRGDYDIRFVAYLVRGGTGENLPLEERILRLRHMTREELASTPMKTYQDLQSVVTREARPIDLSLGEMSECIRSAYTPE